MELRKKGRFFGATRRQETASGLILSENDYLPDQTTPYHAHESILFYLVLDGFCRETTMRNTNTHAASTLVFLDAGEPHATHWLPDSPGRCFHLEMNTSFLQSRLQKDNLLPQGGSLHFESGALPLLMRRLRTELIRWDTHSALIAEGILLELMGEVGRAQTTRLPVGGNWLPAVEACLREQWKMPPTLTELADLAQVHPSHLLRAFRHHYHVTPGEFVRRLRIEEACRRLRTDPALSLSTLARDLGFADQSHFSRTFRKIVGSSPGSYRKSYAA